MSYTIDFIRVRSSVDDTWSTEDLVGGDYTFAEIYSQYTGAVLMISSDIVEGVLYYDIYKDIPNIVDQNVTINDWFLSLDYGQMRFLSTPPNVTHRSVMYMDAMRANYEFKKIDKEVNPTVSVADEHKTDLLITRESTDYQRMDDFCLVSVNGIFHFTEPREDGLVVHYGGRGHAIGRNFNVGIHSFTGLGSITKHRFSDETISRVSTEIPMSEKVRISLSEDLTNKSLLVVIGGYLHHYDEVYTIGNDHVEIDMKRFLFPERLYDALRRTDFPSIYNLMNNEGFGNTSAEVLMSDEFISMYLADSSFFVIVDTPVINKKLEMVSDYGIPGNYYTKKKPILPLLGGYGRVCEYIPEFEYDKWVLHCVDAKKQNFLFNTVDNPQYYDGQLNPKRKYMSSQPYFLNLFVESLIVPEYVPE